MAAITAASGLRPLDKTRIVQKFKGAATTISAGEAVYMSAADTVAIADKDAEATAQAVGIALQDCGAIGAWIPVCTYGPLTGYSGLTYGNTVWLYDNGGLTVTYDGQGAPNGDLAAGDYPSELGFVVNATTIFVRPRPSRVALPSDIGYIDLDSGEYSDVGAGATANHDLFTVPTGYTFTPASITLSCGTVADATFSLQADDADIDTPGAASNGASILTFTDTVDAGEVIRLEFVTQADTGDLDAPRIRLKGYLRPTPGT